MTARYGPDMAAVKDVAVENLWRLTFKQALDGGTRLDEAVDRANAAASALAQMIVAARVG